MTQHSKRSGDLALPFVFIPDGADADIAAGAVSPAQPVRLRARLVLSDDASQQPASAPERHPEGAPPRRDG